MSDFQLTTDAQMKEFLNRFYRELNNIDNNITITYIEETNTLLISGMDYSDSDLVLKRLQDCTFEEIQTIAQSGEAQMVWSVGDRYPITLNGTVGDYTFDNETWYATIIGINHNAELETEGKPSVTFQFTESEDGTKVAFIDSHYGATGTGTGFRMSTSNSDSSSWEVSYMRNTICPQFLAALPEELQTIISPTTKYTDNAGDSTGAVESNVTATQDKIFLLSMYETGLDAGNSYDFTSQSQEPYEMYYPNDSSRKRYRHSNISSSCYWWSRSMVHSNSSKFYYINSDGTIGSTNTYVSYGFAPAFTIF